VNLSERLEAAKREREAIDDAPGVEEPTDDLDVSEPEAATRPQRWGKPSPCPRCNAKGEVDYIDLVRAITSQHCPNCSFEWVLSRSDFDALTS
jgi:hypothetical protein